MNGFLLSSGNFENEKAPKKLLVYKEVIESLEKFSLQKFISFFGWGKYPGDIHYHINKDSFLVLNGYISDAKTLESFTTQKEAAKCLQDLLDLDHSISRCMEIAGEIHGSFSIIYINIPERITFCITDRISSRPLWFRRGQNGWTIASNPNSIAISCEDSGYNFGSLGAFLLYGGPVNPAKSMYEGIEGINEGEIAVFKLDGSRYQKKWYTYRHRPDTALSGGAWVEVVSKRLVSSAERILQHTKKPLVFLSGGIDSRITTAALRAAGGKPITATIGENINLEVKVAQKTAKAFECDHEFIFRDNLWYLRYLQNLVYESGGSFVWTHGHFFEAYRKAQSAFDVDVALLGDFCEAFSKLFGTVGHQQKKVWTKQEFINQFDRLPLPLYRPQNRNLTLRMIKPDARIELENQLKIDIDERYSKACEISDDPKIVADYFFRWQAAATAATFLMFYNIRSAGPERSLMFDKDVHELLEILPSKVRDGANFGSKLIKKLWPSAAKIINSNTLLPLLFPALLQSTSKRIKPALGKLRRTIFEDSHKTVGSWPKKSLLYKNDSKWRDYFDKILLDSSLFEEDIFDQNQIRKSWTQFKQGELSLSADIEKLIQIGILKLNKKQALIINI